MTERVAAFHECGHCVAYLALGVPFHSVNIHKCATPDGKLIQGCTIPRKNEPISHRDMAKIFLCGIIAEAKYRKKALYPIYLSQVHDREMAFDLIESMTDVEIPTTSEETHAELFAEARVLVNQNWVWICALAEILHERKSLSYRQVLAICGFYAV